MASSKSSQTTRNIIFTILALWSIISIIIIVVWATSPSMKGINQCRAELEEQKKTFKEEQVEWTKDRQALEVMVQQGWTNQSQLQNHIVELVGQLKHLNLSLESCRQENVFLKANITWLENEIELHKAIEANLTTRLAQQEDLIEYQQLNLTQIDKELESCQGLHEASLLLKTAAEKQKDACETRKQYLDKQLTKCPKHSSSQATDTVNNGPSAPRTGLLLFMIFGMSLVLIPCK